ncbi:hypothetical protein [Ectobacillus ponti]|uniref:Uncharacterized protein n=1 Tax=Ectobacillus ponti TaxID=2961894 RepID=A0AA41X8W0_9BACI|nr:hypothetical protein [Ectobacillus ponti]MCP8970867.1 hypothetical protein [Ectobacillus ponti]
MTLIMVKEETFTVLEHVAQDVAQRMKQQADAAFLWPEDEEIDWDYGY